MKHRTFFILALLPALVDLGAQDAYLAGIARLSEGDLTAAGQSFEKALAERPNRHPVCLKLAEIAFIRQDYGAAITWAEQANDRAAGSGDYIISQCHALESRPARSVEYLEKHLRSDYKKPRHEILLDPSFSGIENSEHWKSLWKQTWYSESEDLEFEVAYLRKSGHYPDALNRIQDGLGDDPRWHQLYAEKGRTLHLMGNWQDAARAWSKAIEIFPGNWEYYLGRAGAMGALKKFDEGIRDMEKAARLNPEMLDLLKETSQMCRWGKQFKKAKTYIEDYIRYYPDSADGHYHKGSIELDAGEVLQAITSFNRCLELDAGRPEYHAARGRAYLESDTWTYAFQDLSMALDLDPGVAETWYLRGLCQQQLGRKDKARSDFETAARLGSADAIKVLENLDR
jgi:tetratricopeptide (TPR) repeat protein